MTTGDPLELTRELVRIPSVTPHDGGCQEILIRRLEALGFTVHRLPFGRTLNFYARLGTGGSHLCLAGHTDVVPPGDRERWRCDPFAAQVVDGVLYGRGVADMKGGLAALVAAVERHLAGHPDFPRHHSLSFLVTGDEEGEATDGTVRVLDWLQERGERLEWCLVGEPTSRERLGDCIKNGRRGSLNGRIVVEGVQGHVAYPHRARNPIHLAVGAMDQLARQELDRGDDHFDPSSLQFTAVQSGSGATNVIPGRLEAAFNVRFGPCQTPASLEERVRRVLEAAGLTYSLELTVSGLPFITPGGTLLEALQEAIRQELGVTPLPSTGGGTSDARFIARHCPQVVEFGLLAATIHQVDECTPVADLEGLTRVHQRLLSLLFPA